MKKIRITENILRQIVKESVKKVLKESKGLEPSKRDKEFARGMKWDGEPDLNKSNEWRQSKHYSSRGKKKVKGDTSARDLFRRENEKGNFVHKLKTNPGEWVENMCKTSLKESDFNDIRLYVESFLKKNGLYNGPLKWYSDDCFYDSHGCDGYIFDTEDDAVESIINGENHQNAVDYVEGAQTEEEWVDYLIAGGVNPKLAKTIIANQDWDKVVTVILMHDGPEFFLSDYSGKKYKLPNGKLLYY